MVTSYFDMVTLVFLIALHLAIDIISPDFWLHSIDFLMHKIYLTFCSLMLVICQDT